MTRGPFDLEAIRRAHNEFLRLHENSVAEALVEAGEVAKDHVRTSSKFEQRSSAATSAKTTTKARVMRIRGGGIVRIQAPAKHARILEHGSKPHEIAPRSPGGRLRFTSSSGNTVFARSVKHPGTKPYWFLRNASEAAFSALGAQLQRRSSLLAAKFKTLK